MNSEQFRAITKEQSLWMRYEFPKLCTARYEYMQEQVKLNPFWTAPMTEELKEALIKFASKED